MYQDFKHWVKSFLTLSKFEQRGVFVVLVLLMLIAGLNFLLPSWVHHKEYSNVAFKAEIARFEAARKHLDDSLAIVKLQNKKQLTPAQAKEKLRPFPFDPNHLTTKQGIKLGLTLKQIQTIQHYLEKGGKFRKKEDFKKMYCLSEIEYHILSPYIDIPSIYKKNSSEHATSAQLNLAPGSIEINACDTALLIDKLHLKRWMAARIIKYRNLLGNFYSIEQLKEVYGLKKDTYQRIQKYLSCDSSLVKKIDVNHASFKTLVHHPYIDYETTKKIVNSRRYLKGFNKLSELKNLAGIPDSVYEKIRHYLYIGPSEN